MNEIIELISNNTAQIVGGPLELFIMLIASMVYGILLRFIYYSYFLRNEPVDSSIALSFAIIAPSVTTIFWLIQHSLPLSLGLLGALSFVRFRTPVKRAEDIAFILLLIAIALGCAVQKLWVGIMIIGLLSVYIVIRNKVLPNLSFRGASITSRQPILITLHTSEGGSETDLVKFLSTSTNGKVQLISSSTHDNIHSVVVQLPNSSQDEIENIRAAFMVENTSGRFDVFYPNNKFGGY